MKNIPKVIYLQIGDEDIQPDEDFNNLEVRWCSSREFPNDIEYVLKEKEVPKENKPTPLIPENDLKYFNRNNQHKKDTASYVVSGGLQPIGEVGGKGLDIQPIPKPAVYRGTFEDIENALFDYYTKQDLANAASKAYSIVWLLKNESQSIPKEDSKMDKHVL